MTIAIALSIAEGIVLAADSRTTHRVQAEEGKRLDVATDHARKVFPLSHRTGAVTHGRSQINRQTIAGLADRFRWSRAERGAEDVSRVVDEFAAFLREAWRVESDGAQAGAPEDAVGFLVGGYGDDGMGRVYELRLPGGERRVLSTTEVPNYHWRGRGCAVTRLMKGVDPRFDQAALDPKAAEALARLEYVVKLRHMSLRDGVDFVRLLGGLAIGIDRFTQGTLGAPEAFPLAGGRLSIATVTLEGFRWA